ncbi:MAG: hypothetical protein ACRDSP_02895 [Pseudonocardiaceae bacterium]
MTERPRTAGSSPWGRRQWDEHARSGFREGGAAAGATGRGVDLGEPAALRADPSHPAGRIPRRVVSGAPPGGIPGPRLEWPPRLGLGPLG